MVQLLSLVLPSSLLVFASQADAIKYASPREQPSCPDGCSPVSQSAFSEVADKCSEPVGFLVRASGFGNSINKDQCLPLAPDGDKFTVLYATTKIQFTHYDDPDCSGTPTSSRTGIIEPGKPLFADKRPPKDFTGYFKVSLARS